MTIRTENRIDCMNRIMASSLVEKGDNFSVSDVAALLDVNHSIALRYLTDLADGNKLDCRENKAGHYVYSRKLPPLLRMPWRKLTNEQVGIVV